MQDSKQMRVSQENGQSGWTVRGIKVKVNLPTFKDEETKDLVATAHGIGMCLCFATLVGTTNICYPMSLGLCKDSQET